MAAFEAYLDRVLGEEVCVDARARALAARVLRPVEWVPGAWRPLEVLTSGLLPPSLRTAYGLPAPGRAYAALRSALRAGRRVAPRLVWEMPEARAWRKRVGAGLDPPSLSPNRRLGLFSCSGGLCPPRAVIPPWLNPRLALFFRHVFIKLLILSKIVALFLLNFAPFRAFFPPDSRGPLGS